MSEELPADSRQRTGIEFGWKVHDALDSWTAKVDTKASVVLAIEAAIFGFAITLSDKGARLAALTGRRLDMDRAGLAGLALSVILSLAAVMPQLGRRKARQAWRSNLIYFGHLRFWTPADLASALLERGPTASQLAEQLVSMSRIAWRKHVWLQWSLVLLLVGAALLAVAGS